MPLAALLRLQAEPVSAVVSTAPSGPDLTRYFAVCGGLLVLVLVLAHVFRRAFGRALAARAARRSLRVVDVLPLGGAKRLVVVQCYERVFLIGAGDKELCPIAELDSEATAAGKLAPQPAAAQRTIETADRADIGADFARALERSDARASEVQPYSRRAVQANFERGRGILG